MEKKLYLFVGFVYLIQEWGRFGKSLKRQTHAVEPLPVLLAFDWQEEFKNTSPYALLETENLPGMENE